MTMRVYLEPASDPNRSPVDTVYLDSTEMFLMDYKHPALTSSTWYTEMEGEMTPEESGEYVFSLSVAGTAILYIDGKMVVDNENDQTRGDSFFGLGTGERTGVVNLEAGRIYTVLIKHGTLPTSALRVPGAITMNAGGLRIGGMKKIDDQTELEKAVEIAKTVDQVVICAGLNVSVPFPLLNTSYVLNNSIVRLGIRRLRSHQHVAPRPDLPTHKLGPRRQPQHSGGAPIRHAGHSDSLALHLPGPPPSLVQRQRDRKCHRRHRLRKQQPLRQTAPHLPPPM